jgi:hypothetical protein
MVRVAAGAIQRMGGAPNNSLAATGTDREQRARIIGEWLQTEVRFPT